MKKPKKKRSVASLLRENKKLKDRVCELESEMSDCVCDQGPEPECDHDDYYELQKQVDELEKKVEDLEAEKEELEEERNDFEEQLSAEQEHETDTWEEIADRAQDIVDLAMRNQ